MVNEVNYSLRKAPKNDTFGCFFNTSGYTHFYLIWYSTFAPAGCTICLICRKCFGDENEDLIVSELISASPLSSKEGEDLSDFSEKDSFSMPLKEWVSDAVEGGE